MSKKKKKKQRNPVIVHESVEDMSQEIISDMLSCGQCADAGDFKIPKETGLAQVEHLIKVLPGIGYIENLLVDYLFSNGLTTGNIIQDQKLNNFLFSVNKRGDTNLAVLRDAIGNSTVYGEQGLRWYDGNLYRVSCGKYGALTDMDEGIEYPVTWFASAKDEFIGESDFVVPEDVYTIEELFDRMREQDLILLDNSDFVNIRNNTENLHGESPLLSDELRVKLLEAVYSRLNYDIEYDGPGRLILRPKDGYATGEVNEIDTTNLVNQSMIAGTKRLEKAKKEIARVGKEIRNSKSDDVILLSNAFSDNITHLERVTKATQFFDWLENEGAIIAQAMGLPPSLLEMGKVSGNVSMQRILDNAMENAIVPLRQKFAAQISPLLSSKLGIDKVYFGEYHPASAPSKETVRGQVVEQMAMLNAIGTPKTKKLVEDFAEMLSYDIHNSDGSLVKLSIGNMVDDVEYKEKSDYEQNNRRFRQSEGSQASSH